MMQSSYITSVHVDNKQGWHSVIMPARCSQSWLAFTTSAQRFQSQHSVHKMFKSLTKQLICPVKLGENINV